MRKSEWIARLIGLSLVWMLIVPAARAADQPETTIRGVVMPVEWAGKTKPAAVAIRVIDTLPKKGSAEEELRITDYYVADTLKGMALVDLDLVGRDVEVRGMVAEEKGRYYIYVRDFKVLEERRVSERSKSKKAGARG